MLFIYRYTILKNEYRPGDENKENPAACWRLLGKFPKEPGVPILNSLERIGGNNLTVSLQMF